MIASHSRGNKSLKKNNTWDLIELAPNKRTIGSKWIFKTKLNGNSNIECYKAHLVAKCYNQKFRSEYNETFAPVMKLTTIRAFLAKQVTKECS